MNLSRPLLKVIVILIFNKQIIYNIQNKLYIHVTLCTFVYNCRGFELSIELIIKLEL